MKLTLILKYCMYGTVYLTFKNIYITVLSKAFIFAEVLRCLEVVLSTYLDLLVPLLHAQAGPPQVVQTQASTCSSLLHLLLRLPPSTSPPRPPLLLCLLTYQPSPLAWCLSAQRDLCSSSLSTRVLKSPAGQTPHPSPSHFQAKRTGRSEGEKKARVR